MGQKVNPVGMRVGIGRNWNSRWFADKREYSTYLQEDLRIRTYLEKEVRDAGLSHIEIERRKLDKGTAIAVFIFVSRPGVLIGQDGSNINRITKVLKKMFPGSSVRLSIVDIKQPDLDARLVAESIARDLENRSSFRIAQKRAIQRVRRAGAKGCRTLVSGRLGGNDIARSEGYKDGIIPLHTLRSDIDYAMAEAVTAYGRLGVKVWICRGDYKTAEEKEAEAQAGVQPTYGRSRRPERGETK